MDVIKSVKAFSRARWVGAACACAAGLAAASAMASADVESVTEARCRTTRAADAGYEIQVERVLRDGKLYATVLEQTLAGPRVVGRARVAREEERGVRAYRSLDLKLEIQLERDLPGIGPARRLLGRASGEAIRAPELAQELACELGEPAPLRILPVKPEPSLTCQALFSGFEFVAGKGRCEAREASGCASPFEFETLKDCERAYSLSL